MKYDPAEHYRDKLERVRALIERGRQRLSPPPPRTYSASDAALVNEAARRARAALSDILAEPSGAGGQTQGQRLAARAVTPSWWEAQVRAVFDRAADLARMSESAAPTRRGGLLRLMPGRRRRI